MRGLRIVGRFLCVALLCVTGKAQQTSREAEAVSVPPAGQGYRFSSYLFHKGCSGSRQTFYQILFEVPRDVPAVVRSIAFRRAPAPVDCIPFTVEVEIGVGHSPRSAASFGWERPMNRGPDFEIVLGRKSFSFPRSRYRPGVVYPFEYRFPLDKPFAFQPGRNAVIELRILESTLCMTRNDPVAVEWEGGERRLRGSRFGTACSSFGVDAGNSLGVLDGISPGNPGMAWMEPVPAGNAPNLCRYFGGTSRLRWGGLKLPYHLDPLGAPGCSLYISFDWEWPTFWGPWFPLAALDLPNEPNLTGMTICMQGVRFDRSANALGMDASNGWSLQVSPHIDATVSTLQGQFGPTPECGERRLFGPVFQLSGR